MQVTVCLLALLTGLFYMTGEPVWDDHVLIVEDLAQRSWGSIAELWISPVGDVGPGQGYYRPLSMTLMAILGSHGVWWIHLCAALLHAGSTGLVMWLLRGHRGQILAGLCFGLHPLSSEVLGWASALPDALAVFLALAAVVWIPRSLGWGLILAVAAVASKETGFLVLLFLVGGFQGTRKGAICLGAGAVFLFLPRLLLGIEGTFNVEGREDMFASAVAWPMSWLIWPHPLTVVHDLWVAPDWVLWASPILGVGMIWLARHSRLGLLATGLCVAAPLLALWPSVSGLMVAERYMYPGLVGLALWVGAVVPTRPLTVAFAIIWGSVSMGSHLIRAGEWQTDRSLFYAAAADMPTSALSQHFKSVICKREHDWVCVANISYELMQYDGPNARLQGPPPNEVYTLASLMEALVQINLPEVALQWAEGHPEQAMESDYFVWAWAWAAIEAGQREQAIDITQSMVRPDDWRAPVPLAELMTELSRKEKSP